MRRCQSSSPSFFSARCTLITILPLHSTDGETEAHRGEGILMRSCGASEAADQNFESSALCPTRSAWPSQATESRGHFIESQSEVSKEKKKRSSRRSSQGWSAAQLVPGLREGGNDAARARGSLRSTIRRESACGGSQRGHRGSGKDV